MKVSRKAKNMQLIQTKVYSTRKAVHARYVLDCQNEEKTFNNRIMSRSCDVLYRARCV